MVAREKKAKRKELVREAPIAGSGDAFPFAYVDLVRHPAMERIVKGLKGRGNVTVFEGGIGFEPEPVNLGIMHVMRGIGMENIKKAYWFEPNSVEYWFNKMALDEGSLKGVGGKVELSQANVFTDKPPEECDLVFSHMVMPHFEKGEREEFFKRLVEMTKEGGHLIVDVLPPYGKEYVKHDLFNETGRQLEVGDVEGSRKHLEEMGLELVDASMSFFILRKKSRK